MTSSVDIPPIGAPSPAPYVKPRQPKQDRRPTNGGKQLAEPSEEPNDHDEHDGIDCYT